MLPVAEVLSYTGLDFPVGSGNCVRVAIAQVYVSLAVLTPYSPLVVAQPTCFTGSNGYSMEGAMYI